LPKRPANGLFWRLASVLKDRLFALKFSGKPLDKNRKKVVFFLYVLKWGFLPLARDPGFSICLKTKAEQEFKISS
jgi:hypothetical protein